MTAYRPIKDQLQLMYCNLPEAHTNILSSLKGSRFHITFNRPKRYNAFSSDMYYTFTSLIHYANQNDAVKFIVISGAGGNFSSGNDLMNFSNSAITSLGTNDQMARVTGEVLSDLNQAIINSKKPIFAITEGKVIGFAFTQLALYDRVFAVTSSEFNAPLVKLAQGPEMCASYTFPKIFGKSIGEGLLVKGSKVDTAFLQRYGMINSCKSRAEAESALGKHLDELQQLDWASYLKSRQLFREIDRKALLETNRREIDNLVERWCNPELPRLLMEYMANVKSKSKL